MGYLLPMRAKITAYNNPSSSDGCSDFSLNTYWGTGYKNTYYLCGDLGRPTFNDTIETTVDSTGKETRIKNTSVERYTVSTIVGSPFLSILKTIDKHEVIIFSNLDTGDNWNIKNINIDDDGSLLEVNQRVLLSFEIDAITNNNNTDYVIKDGQLSYWDNTNNGAKNIDGSAFYNANGIFSSWQLYYESDDITPATVGDVTMYVYAQKNGSNSLLGIFNGGFGDSFDDSSKWQSTQSIWTYFDAADTVGHANIVQFNKEQFAADNGYSSDELEDRSTEIRFDLSINNSTVQPTTLDLVYSTAGAFNATAVQGGSGEYGITTINKDFEPITVSSQNDVRQALPGGGTSLVTSFIKVSDTDYSNQYQIGVALNEELGYRNTFVTSGGYLGSSYRGQYLGDGFDFSLDPAYPVIQTSNILSHVTGNSPFNLQLRFRFNKNTTFADLGDVIDGTDVVYLDGVIDTTLSVITSTSTFVSGNFFLTLPDTEKHVVRLEVETTGGDKIFSEFELQIKPKF